MVRAPIPGWWSLATRSLRFFWRSHLAVACGIAAATAVIVGALVVGDCVRGSLRGLVTDRLGNVQAILHAQTYFDAETLTALTVPEHATIGPAILLPSATAESKVADQLRQASQVQLLGVTPEFWQQVPASHALPSSTWPETLGEDEIVMNAGLANELGLQVGDDVTVRFERNAAVPADNPLGRRDDPPISLPRQKLVAILPDDSVGGFSLRTSQTVPKNIFFALSDLQEALEVQGVNAAWLSSEAARPMNAIELESLNNALHPSLEDYGLQFNRHTLEYALPGESNNGQASQQVIFDYHQVSSRDLILDNETSVSLSQLQPKPQRLMAYLANAIYRVAADGKVEQASEVPYSIVTGVDPGNGLDLDRYTTLAKEDIRSMPCWINSWLAEQLPAKPGDMIQINYYEPETVDGREIETTVQAVVVGIVPITTPATSYVRQRQPKYDRAPTIFNDPDLTPTVPGVTDQDSIANWDVPFTMDRKVNKEDDAYWNRHRLTPKLFLRYDDASSLRLFGSRFGRTTSLRFEAQGHGDPEALRRQIESALLKTKHGKGLTFQPTRAQQLQAAAGTTPFDMLFLSLSFFVIVAALLLTSLLFRLGIQQRMSQVGLLLAQGFNASGVRGLLLREIALVAGIGAILGIALGLLYAKLMLVALQSWWLGAISVAFLKFTFTPQSLALGALGGAVASLLTILLSIRRLTRQPPLSLLRGQHQDTSIAAQGMNSTLISGAVVCSVAALALSLFGMGQSGMERAGCFFGSGMLLLVGALIAAREGFVSRGAVQPKATQASLIWLAWLAICRNPTRSVLSSGLLAVATFLIASMSLFQMAPSQRGYGGFDLVAEASQPIYRNLASPTVREETLGAKAMPLQAVKIASFRARLRDDASCNNLFQAPEPTVLGVPRIMNEMDLDAPPDERFQWAAAIDRNQPWQALEELATGASDSPIPVVLDQNTAAWSLHQGAAIGAITKLQFAGQDVYFKTIGLLSNSILQGKLMISEENFQSLFPSLSGYQYFMIRSGDSDPQVVTDLLESGWSDNGFDVSPSEEILRRLLSVQNTYISAFQSLGALGLLLGTLGLAAVQTRSVIERRKELALLRAVGFSNQRLAGMLTLETGMLLLGGMAIGILSAAVAIVPYLLETGPQSGVLQPFLMIGMILICGFATALLAIRTALRLPILAGLRSE